MASDFASARFALVRSSKLRDTDQQTKNGENQSMTAASAFEQERGKILNHVSVVVSAYVSNNAVALSDVPKLIQDTFSTLSTVAGDSETATKPTPAVPIRKSVLPDFIVCLEDGKKLKMLKRYLKSAYDMTPEQYRERWGLSPNYPMVSPNYAKKRSLLAKQIGLGTRRGQNHETARLTAGDAPDDRLPS